MGSKLLYTLPALGLAFLALVLALIGLSQGPESSAPQVTGRKADTTEQAPVHRYWVVRESVPVGATLTEDKLGVVSSPTPIPEALAADQPVAGKEVKRLARAGELLSAHHLEAGGNLPASLPEGHRAIAIAVDNVVGAGGLLQPGDRVDVVTAFRRSDKDNPVALVMLRGITVLAVKGALSAAEQSDDNRRNDTVVLSVPEEKVSALMLASSQGQVRLAVVADQEPAADQQPEDQQLADRQSTDQESTEQQRTADTATPPSQVGPAPRVVASDESGPDQPFYFDDFFPEPSKAAAPAKPRASPGRRVQVLEGPEMRSTYVR
ncbi:Flp pilus assembly protein CpaB [Alloalcanivorax gelatiniphagus]|nr:Flp pilus assembly protein CpaB [Alloalcanivorax gelatiniphagus]|tara:strand:+ start:29724 stop:30686 length:963 start_codon:yes stop_codon:yes gene_type:complete